MSNSPFAPSCTACALLVLSLGLCGQTQHVRIDFGQPTSPSAGTSPAWNDVHLDNVGLPHALVDVGGVVTGITLVFVPGKVFAKTIDAGVQIPTPGSALAALAWPVSAMRDAMWSSSSTPEIEFTLAGLDPAATYDFTLLGSRLGATEERTTLYGSDGTLHVEVSLDPSNNTSEVVSALGIRSDAGGTLRFLISAAATNASPRGFFYLNALEIVDYAAGQQPRLVAFTTNELVLTRTSGRGPFAVPLELYANDGSTPTLTLSAVDDVTQAAPTWLSVPAGAAVGTPFDALVDASALAAGTYSATVSALGSGLSADVSVLLIVRAPGTLNILHYGNSYSQGNQTAADLVEFIAEEAGFPPPNNVKQLVGGQNLAYHLTNPTQAAAITQALSGSNEGSEQGAVPAALPKAHRLRQAWTSAASPRRGRCRSGMERSKNSVTMAGLAHPSIRSPTSTTSLRSGGMTRACGGVRRIRGWGGPAGGFSAWAWNSRAAFPKNYGSSYPESSQTRPDGLCHGRKRAPEQPIHG